MLFVKLCALEAGFMCPTFSNGTDHWFKEFCAVLAAPENLAIAISAHL